jgi:starvation-inducible DNA-binding protein
MGKKNDKDAIVTLSKKTKETDVVEAFSGFLATTYTLYMETLNYHWNVTGEHFITLHALFETQYDELRLAADEIAERIRAMGGFAPATYREFLVLSSIQEPTTLPKSGMKMVENLLKHHEIASKEAKSVLNIAEAASDDVSVDMMVGRITVHDKTAWMLRSLLA